MRVMTKSNSAVIVSLMAFFLGGDAAIGQGGAGTNLTPVVLFPAFHFTRLEVKVRNQNVAPGCPSSGTFEDLAFTPEDPVFGQVCQDKLLTLVYDPNPNRPMHRRFSDQPGVKVGVADYGKTESAPFYEDLYVALETAGYERNENIRVAGYDSRLTPEIGNFLKRTVKLIERTYHQNGNTPVHLIGHSNGPLYAQYLLTHTTQAWKNKYIHGFTPFAGNWPGQGLFYPVYFTGLNISNFGFPETVANATSSALMYLSHPSSYMSSANPAIFHDDEVVVRIPGRDYTPEDFDELFDDAGLNLAQELAAHYIGFVEFADPAHFPNVDVYAEKGSGIPTAVGLELPDLTVGQLAGTPPILIERPGDINQEDITNDSVEVWEAMPCFRFEMTDNPNVNHFELVSKPDILQRLLVNLQRPRSVCP